MPPSPLPLHLPTVILPIYTSVELIPACFDPFSSWEELTVGNVRQKKYLVMWDYFTAWQNNLRHRLTKLRLFHP